MILQSGPGAAQTTAGTWIRRIGLYGPLILDDRIVKIVESMEQVGPIVPGEAEPGLDANHCGIHLGGGLMVAHFCQHKGLVRESGCEPAVERDRPIVVLDRLFSPVLLMKAITSQIQGPFTVRRGLRG